jgi:ribosome biogenesis GTPase
MTGSPREDGRLDSEEAVGGRAAVGRVLACFHDEWEVALESGEVARCSVRARHFARLEKDAKLLVPGDRVEVSVGHDGSCVIEDRLPRDTALSRRLPGAKYPTEQIIVANADQLVAVASLGTPPLNRRLLDRFLVIAEDAELGSIVVLNKIDLVAEADWRPVACVYERAGYEVVPTCALDGTGVGRLVSLLAGRLSVFAGASGAGKSSLLNAIEPGLGIRVREVSEKTGKGRHTTTNVTIFPVGDDTLVADTPGFRELGLWRVHPDDLDHLFPEFRDLMPGCRFRGGRHRGCPRRGALRQLPQAPRGAQGSLVREPPRNRVTSRLRSDGRRVPPCSTSSLRTVGIDHSGP